MCGVIGVISRRPVLDKVVQGLLALENRGKESTGIAGYSVEHRRFVPLINEAKPASETYTEEFFRKYGDSPVTLAIGHNRYATSGDDVTRDIQPLRITRPGIVGCHNGQVANLVTLEKSLRGHEWSLNTTCDVELLLGALGQGLRQHEATTTDTKAYIHRRLRPALHELMDKDSPLFVNGAYSFLTIIDGQGLMAVRDPYGIRPLVWSERKEEDGSSTYAFASEPTAFHAIGGFGPSHAVSAGEAIFIDFELNKHHLMINKKGEAHCAFEYPYFANVASKLEGVSVYDARIAIGHQLAKEHPEFQGKIDLVMPIPDSPRPIAKGFADAMTGLNFDDFLRYAAIGPSIAGREIVEMARNGLITPHGEGVIKNPHFSKRVFQERSPERRQAALRLKYEFIKSQVDGRRVAVVDDSIVRADTMRYVNARLRELGAREIHAFIGFPPILFPCPYGIDTPQYEELIAHKLGANMPAIAQHVYADSVNYISHRGLYQAIGLPAEKLCMACTNGQYPTGKGVKEYTELRTRQRERQA